jgi:uncharacterized protein (DUF934 family)
MHRLIRGRAIVEDAWRYPGEAGDGPQVLTLAEFQAAAAIDGGATLAVQLEPADAVEALAPHIARLALVVVHFPKDGEGRGFSQGQLLRQRYGYRGELRAAGAFKRDYLFFLARCGFDAFEPNPAEQLEAALAAFGSFTVGYQPGSDYGVRLRGRPTANAAGAVR